MSQETGFVNSVHRSASDGRLSNGWSSQSADVLPAGASCLLPAAGSYRSQARTERPSIIGRPSSVNRCPLDGPSIAGHPRSRPFTADSRLLACRIRVVSNWDG